MFGLALMLRGLKAVDIFNVLLFLFPIGPFLSACIFSVRRSPPGLIVRLKAGHSLHNLDVTLRLLQHLLLS